MIVNNVFFDEDLLRDNLQMQATYLQAQRDPISAMEYEQKSKGQVPLHIYVEYAWKYDEFACPIFELNTVDITLTDINGDETFYRLSNNEVDELEKLL